MPASCQRIEKQNPALSCRVGRIIRSLRSLMILMGGDLKEKARIRFTHPVFVFPIAYASKLSTH
jgi:hypothetical protein